MKELEARERCECGKYFANLKYIGIFTKKEYYEEKIKAESTERSDLFKIYAYFDTNYTLAATVDNV